MLYEPFINANRLAGDDWETALTLLHELGHVYIAVPRASGSPVQKGLAGITGDYDDGIVENCLR